MAVFLVPIGEGRPVVLDKAIVLIGRQSDCDVVLTSSRRVSRRHCCVAHVNETFIVRDLGSLNGVRVNGERIKNESRLQFGDVISIGDLGYVLQTKNMIPNQDRSSQVDDLTAVDLVPNKKVQKTSENSADSSHDYPVAITDECDSIDVDSMKQGDRQGAFSHPEKDSVYEKNVTDDSRDSEQNERHGSDNYKGTNSHFELLPERTSAGSVSTQRSVSDPETTDASAG